MTDVREVELTEVLTPTERNELGPAHGRDLSAAPAAKPLKELFQRTRTGIRWRPWLMLMLYFSPTILTAGYYGFVASDRYVSTASFILRTASKPTGSGGLSSILRMAGLSRSDDDTYSVQNFILSRDAVKRLEEKLPLADMYGRPGADFIARYPSWFYGKTNEELYKYYLRMTSAIYVAVTGVTTLEVQAFRPDDAQAIATSLLDLSEDLVNQLNLRIHKDAVSAAEDQVKTEEKRLTDAQVAITAFQNREGMIDPVNNSVQVSSLVGKLNEDLAQTQARITDMKAASPNNPSLIGLQRQAEVTRAQIAQERERITTAQEGLADKLGVYQRLVLEREFATKALSAANSALDSARQEVRRKQLYIERIVEPNLSDRATMPFSLWTTMTVAAINLLALFLGWMVMSGVKEHVSSTR